MTKTQEIIEKMKAGASPADLIGQGYKRGLVYKVNKTLRSTSSERGELTPSNPCGDSSIASTSTVDSTIEGDPEILELKKELRKAELRRQLAEINAPIELEARINALENKAKEVGDQFNHLFDEWIDLRALVDNTPLAGLRQIFKCSCGAVGALAVAIQCTACGTEKTYGWSPNNNAG